jgi:hypothetical protein
MKNCNFIRNTIRAVMAAVCTISSLSIGGAFVNAENLCAKIPEKADRKGQTIQLIRTLEQCPTGTSLLIANEQFKGAKGADGAMGVNGANGLQGPPGDSGRVLSNILTFSGYTFLENGPFSRTAYFPLNGFVPSSTTLTESQARIVVPRACILEQVAIMIDGVLTGLGTVTSTLFVNGVASVGSCSVSETVSGCSITNPIVLAKGATISLELSVPPSVDGFPMFWSVACRDSNINQ